MKSSHLLLPLALLAGAAACTTSDVGSVELTLTGTSPSGTIYRLRDARLDLTGPDAHATMRTEDDPTRVELVQTVPAGSYTLDLADGWRLERVDPVTGAATTVAATLVSADPMPLTVVADQLTPAVLRFRAGGDDVALGDGDVVVVIDVEEGSPDAGAPELDAPPAPVTDAAAPEVLDASPAAPAPSVTIWNGPSGTITTTTATFAWSTTGAEAVDCRLDAAPFAACPDGSRTFAGLTEGTHQFTVRATNVDGVEAIASRSFAVELP